MIPRPMRTDAPPETNLLIERFRLTEVLHPGESAKAHPLIWRKDPADGRWWFFDAGWERTIWDLYDKTGLSAGTERFGVNFGLVGEIFQAVRRLNTGRIEVIGSKGLRRKAKANAKIEPDETGEVTIWTKGASTGVVVEASYDWMTQGDIQAGHELVIDWFVEERTDNPGWVITQWECP